MHYSHEMGVVERDGIRRSAEGPIDEDPYQVEEANYLRNIEATISSLTPTCLHTTHQH